MKRTTKIIVDSETLTEHSEFTHPACRLAPDFFTRANSNSLRRNSNGDGDALTRTLLAVVDPDGRDILRVEGK